MIFVSILALVGFASAWAVASGRPAAVALFVSVTSAGSALYLFALAGALAIGAWLLLVAGLAAGGWAVVKTLRTGRVGLLLSPAIVAVVQSCLVYSFHLRGRHFLSSDEYANWGRLTKYLVETDALPRDPQGPIILPTYAPGAGLVHYFVQHPGGFSEPGTYVAQFFLLIVGLAVFWEGLSWRQAARGLWVALAGLGWLLLLGLRLDLLLVEGVLATHLAALLWMARHATFSVRSLLAFVPPIFFLPLIKNAGLLMSLTVALAVLGVWLGRSRADSGPETGSVSRSAGGRWVALVLVALVIMGPLARASWLRHCRAQGFERHVGITNVAAADVRRALSPRATEVEREIIATFLGEGLTRVPVLQVAPAKPVMELLASYGLEALPGLLDLDLRSAWLVIALASVLVAAGARRRDRWALATSLAALLVGMIACLAALLVAYLFRMGPMLISFARYVAPFTGAAAVLLTAVWLDRVALWRCPGLGRRGQSLAVALPGALLVTGLFGLAWDKTHLKVLRDPGGRPGIRADLDPRARQVADAVRPGSRVYLISQGGTHYQDLLAFQMFGYSLTPLATNHRHFRPGQISRKAPGFDDPDTWARMLREGGYDYVYVIQADGGFWDSFAGLFSPGALREPGLFEIGVSGGESVVLRPRPLKAGARG